ncbi:hypothetical protein N7470_000026 [Penicillium chermesinum]|nr:hypothetical protein N7470_000026 [Penicillium chermesinum]
MRQLGSGQSIVFCIPYDIKARIHDSRGTHEHSEIGVPDILRWAIFETWNDIKRSMPLWAVQGRRFTNQRSKWQNYQRSEQDCLTSTQAKSFLEPECLSLQQRYKPHNTGQPAPLASAQREAPDAIETRCAEVEGQESCSPSLHEEQERELAPEIQTERQKHRPPPAEPAIHRVHSDLCSFIETGVLKLPSEAYGPAFASIQDTSAPLYVDLHQFGPGLMVTTDFTKTIKVPRRGSSVMDAYQRPVRFILTAAPSKERDTTDEEDGILIISPHEANMLMPHITKSTAVTIHLYSPRQNEEHGPLDGLMLFNRSRVRETRRLLRIFACN